VRDGLSNTLAMSEFVHSDRSPTTSSGAANGFYGQPGNVRPWMPSNTGQAQASGFGFGSYAFKVIEYTPNTVRDRDGKPPATLFNWLPMGSYHPGGVNALYGDGSVRFVDDLVSLTVWRAISTVDGGESEALP
jgi:prepilin-type processing-associated H-X9-DG protein